MICIKRNQMIYLIKCIDVYKWINQVINVESLQWHSLSWWDISAASRERVSAVASGHELHTDWPWTSHPKITPSRCTKTQTKSLFSRLYENEEGSGLLQNILDKSKANTGRYGNILPQRLGPGSIRSSFVFER